MQKIFKLKKWFTLSQATRYLSEAFEDEITFADIFQFAEDKLLTLSVNFINSVRVSSGEIVQFENANICISPKYTSIDDFRTIPTDFHDEIPSEIIHILSKSCAHQQISELETKQLNLFFSNALPEDLLPVTYRFCGELLSDGTGVIEINSKLTQRVSGIWDIPMIGRDQFIIKQHLLNCLNGSELNLLSLKGTFLASEDRTKWIVLRNKDDTLENYELPEDCTIVIRTKELQRFIDFFNESNSPSPRSEDNNLKTIALLTKALADRLGSGYGTSEKPNISRMYEEILSKHIPEDTNGLAKSTVTERIKQGLKLIK